MENPLIPYVCHYRWEGETRKVVVEASSPEEAYEHLQRMPWGHVVHPLYGGEQCGGKPSLVDRAVIWCLTRLLGVKKGGKQ